MSDDLITLIARLRAAPFPASTLGREAADEIARISSRLSSCESLLADYKDACTQKQEIIDSETALRKEAEGRLSSALKERDESDDNYNRMTELLGAEKRRCKEFEAEVDSLRTLRVTQERDRAVNALEAIRDGIPGPVLHALDTLNGLKRMESDCMAAYYERAVETPARKSEPNEGLTPQQLARGERSGRSPE